MREVLIHRLSKDSCASSPAQQPFSQLLRESSCFSQGSFGGREGLKCARAMRGSRTPRSVLVTVLPPTGSESFLGTN